MKAARLRREAQRWEREQAARVLLMLEERDDQAVRGLIRLFARHVGPDGDERRPEPARMRGGAR